MRLIHLWQSRETVYGQASNGFHVSCCLKQECFVFTA